MIPERYRTRTLRRCKDEANAMIRSPVEHASVAKAYTEPVRAQPRTRRDRNPGASYNRLIVTPPTQQDERKHLPVTIPVSSQR